MPGTSTIEPPKRILSASVTAKHLRVSRPTFSKYERRGVVKPDYLSDGGTFYEFDRLADLAGGFALRITSCSAGILSQKIGRHFEVILNEASKDPRASAR